VLVINNGVDVPQSLNPIDSGTDLVDLPNWPASTLAQVVRPFKNYLVALDITKSGTRFRQMVKWSHNADPGTVPTSWDETDPTIEAGEYSLAETDGAVLDCLPLRDLNIIYKEDSVWGMQLIGGTFVFRFFLIFSAAGALSQQCVAAFEGNHVFLSNDMDVFVHDGQNVRSIADDRWRNWLRDNIDSENFPRCFLAVNHFTKEIWVCLPEEGQDFATKAIVWNWRRDTWAPRQLPGNTAAESGVIVSSAYIPTWDTIAGTWDNVAGTWTTLGSVPPTKRMVMAAPDVGLIEYEFGSDELGAPLPAVLERLNTWAFAGATDLQSVKFVRRMRFRLKGSEAATATVNVAVEMDLTDAPVWQVHTIAVHGTAEIVVAKRGRFLSIRFESDDDITAKLLSIELDADPSGDY